MSRDSTGPHHSEPNPGIQPPSTDGVQWHHHRWGGSAGDLGRRGCRRHLRHGLLHSHSTRFDSTLSAARAFVSTASLSAICAAPAVVRGAELRQHRGPHNTSRLRPGVREAVVEVPCLSPPYLLPRPDPLLPQNDSEQGATGRTRRADTGGGSTQRIGVKCVAFQQRACLEALRKKSASAHPTHYSHTAHV
jgi:hypothetical protein